jgi:hypothetical protein
LHFDNSAKVGDIITAASVLIAGATLFIARKKDRELRRRELADRIRRAASLTVAKLERWIRLSRQLFDDIQPLLVSVAAQYAENDALAAARVALAQGLLTLPAQVKRGIVAEEIEVAYVDLFGFDSRTRELFTETLAAFEKEFDAMVGGLLQDLQKVLQDYDEDPTPTIEAELQNRMYDKGVDVRIAYEALQQYKMDRFRGEMIKFIQATDSDIVNRRIPLSTGSWDANGPDIPSTG